MSAPHAQRCWISQVDLCTVGDEISHQSLCPIIMIDCEVIVSCRSDVTIPIDSCTESPCMHTHACTHSIENLYACTHIVQNMIYTQYSGTLLQMAPSICP